MRTIRLRRPGFTWTAAFNPSRLGCWALQLTAGQRSGAGVTPLARDSTTQRAWSTWRPCPHKKRTARCPSWSVTRQTPPPRFLAVTQEGTGAVSVPGSLIGALGDHPAGASPFGILCPRLLIAASLPPLVWLSALSSLPPPLLVRVPPTSDSSSLPLSPSPLLCSLLLLLPVLRPADVGGSLPPGLEFFRPLLASTLLPALAARDFLPDPLARPRLALATDPSPPALLSVGIVAPGVVDVASDLVRGG